ncbi:major facilitator superfamily domain-containing protein [Pyronema domesticum]|uniref:Similar to Inorganic phosphate transporter PHO84 acc. no. P25297 n=1 Tax=Pyronema omphalodes (strain CBS 100304) TaxID=1076935 RepID=U4LLG8_PYROM|nr:major facilitator superfamily domain-containing protein [Pyronema domesticum]CCX32773.1 Similar to Inorganic phosphate transporter PHO84; acc. no. P25297 [Pyronema omphalodes CBS 100304]
MAAQLGKTAGGNSAFKNFNNQFAHITDPNERRRLALAEIDKAPFGWYHVRAVVVAGVGFFTDSYDIFAINLVTAMLGLVYWKGGKIPEHSDTAIKVSTSGGTVIGQLGFGWLADIVGRKKMYGLELLVIIVATLAQSLTSESYSMHIVGLLVFWRVIMGIGIGGDYPLSSIITSEFATTKWRGAMMGAVFAMQGIGQFAAALVALIVTVAFKKHTVGKSIDHCDIACKTAVDRMWRIIIGFGAVPACIALYYRLTIPETPRFTFDVQRDVEKAAADAEHYMSGATGNAEVDEIRRVNTQVQSQTELEVPKASWADFTAHYGQWRYGKILLGTAGSWFLLDVAFYGLGLNNSVILQAIGYSAQSTVYEKLYNNAVGNLILICAGSIPGYWVTVATVDTVGRKPIQLMGFVILTILFCVIGFAFHSLSKNALLALYVLCQFFFNFGPNATTFIVPGECFPTRYRSTSHGISAASGKVGAIIAQVLIGPLRVRGKTPTNDSPWLNHVMQIFAAFMFAGIFTTLLIPETKRKTLEELCGELYGEGIAKEEAALQAGEPQKKEMVA